MSSRLDQPDSVDESENSNVRFVYMLVFGNVLADGEAQQERSQTLIRLLNCVDKCGALFKFDFITKCFEIEGDEEAKQQKTKFTYEHVKDFKDVLEVFRSRGLVAECTTSVDEDEVFMKIGAPEHVLRKHAEKLELQMAVIGGNGQMAFERGKEELYEKQEDGSLWRESHIQAILMSIMKGKKFGRHMAKLKKKKILRQIIILHDAQKLEEFKHEWALAFFKTQPLDKIRNYFGEKVAMYFAWLGFYTMWLTAPAIVGVIVFALQFGLFRYYSSDQSPLSAETKSMLNRYDSPLTPFFVFFLAVWATAFIEFWKRKSVSLALTWDMMDFEETETVREDYRFALRTVQWGSFHNRMFSVPLRVSKETGQEKFYPTRLKVLAQIISYPSIAAMVGACLVSMIYARFLRETLLRDDSKADPLLSTAIGQLNTIILIFFNSTYKKLSVKLNDIENYRTQTDYENALILKTAVFQFINSYGALLIISFWPYPVGSEQDALRMQFLFYQLLTIQANKVVIDNAKEIGIPMLKSYLLSKWESQQAIMRARELGMSAKDPTFEDVQAKRAPYESPFDDYAEMCIQFGYIVMFAAGFPLGGLISLINNVLEIRVDSYKLVVENQRPPATGAENIGTWLTVLEGLVVASIISNSLFIATTSNALHIFYEVKTENQIQVFIGIEHFLLIIMFALKVLVTDVPKWVRQELAFQDYMKDEILRREAVSVKSNKPTVRQVISGSVPQNNQTMQVAEDDATLPISVFI